MMSFCARKGEKRKTKKEKRRGKKEERNEFRGGQPLTSLSFSPSDSSRQSTEPPLFAFTCSSHAFFFSPSSRHEVRKDSNIRHSAFALPIARQAIEKRG